MYTLPDFMRNRGATFVKTTYIGTDKYLAFTKLPLKDPKRFTEQDSLIMVPVDKKAINDPMDKYVIIMDNGGDETCVGELKAIIDEDFICQAYNFKNEEQLDETLPYSETPNNENKNNKTTDSWSPGFVFGIICIIGGLFLIEHFQILGGIVGILGLIFFIGFIFTLGGK